MGNSNSDDHADGGANASPSPAADAAPVDAANAASTGTLNERPRSNSAARRIIKATHPKADPASLAVDVNVNVSDETEDKLEGSSNRISYPVSDSPSVARENEQEKADYCKKERMQTATERQRANREKEMQERRNKSHKHPEQEVKAVANPMSRFLSVFSVEPAHPEHKRAFEESPEDKQDLAEPSGKRLRASETGGDDSSSDKETSKAFSSTVIAAVVAVAAVIAGVVLRWRRA
jgi:hypothetical protein